MLKNIHCAIVGAGGYVGAELAMLLVKHPAVASLQLFHSGRDNSDQQKNSTPFSLLHPPARHVIELDVVPFALDKVSADIVFLATPHEVSAHLAMALLAQGKVVLDLSGAFRLKKAGLAQLVYGLQEHEAALVNDAVYGIAEFVDPKIRAAKFISVPGCYPTAATLALKPLADAGWLSGQVAPIVSAVSGVSGAGKKAQAHTQFCEVSLTPYGVHTHRHQPEIAQNINGPVVFTPHLGNFNRGILASCYAYLNKPVKADAIASLYHATYAAHTLIRVLPNNEWPAIKNVAHTPFADLAFSVDEAQQQVSVFVAIDNLLKGAASQAIQLFNLQQGFASHTGLIAGA